MEVLAECSHPFTITTKSDRVTSVLDILAPMAEHNLVSVMISITSLTPEIARTLEPREPRPDKRLAPVRALADAGVPVHVSIAPAVPASPDHEIAHIRERARSEARRVGQECDGTRRYRWAQS